MSPSAGHAQVSRLSSRHTTGGAGAAALIQGVEGVEQAELTAAVLPEREDMGGPLRSGDHIGRAP